MEVGAQKITKTNLTEVSAASSLNTRDSLQVSASRLLWLRFVAGGPARTQMAPHTQKLGSFPGIAEKETKTASDRLPGFISEKGENQAGLGYFAKHQRALLE